MSAIVSAIVSLKSPWRVDPGLPQLCLKRKTKLCYCFGFVCLFLLNNMREAQLRSLQRLRNAVPGGNASFDAICPSCGAASLAALDRDAPQLPARQLQQASIGLARTQHLCAASPWHVAVEVETPATRDKIRTFSSGVKSVSWVLRFFFFFSRHFFWSDRALALFL